MDSGIYKHALLNIPYYTRHYLDIIILAKKKSLISVTAMPSVAQFVEQWAVVLYQLGSNQNIPRPAKVNKISGTCRYKCIWRSNELYYSEAVIIRTKAVRKIIITKRTLKHNLHKSKRKEMIFVCSRLKEQITIAWIVEIALTNIALHTASTKCLNKIIIL